MSNSFILEAQKLSHQIEYESQWILKDISYGVKEAEIHGIAGKSGSGKTTLLHLLSGLAKPSKGRVMIKGENIHDLTDNKQAEWRQETIGFIFQSPLLLTDFTCTENIALSQIIRGVSFEQAMKEARACMEKLDITHLDNKPVQDLSGGEKQRVNIGRALVHSPKILFADEPTGSLDSENTELVQKALICLAKEKGTALVIVSHDKSLIQKTTYPWYLENHCLQVGS